MKCLLKSLVFVFVNHLCQCNMLYMTDSLEFIENKLCYTKTTKLFNKINYCKCKKCVCPLIQVGLLMASLNEQ